MYETEREKNLTKEQHIRGERTPLLGIGQWRRIQPRGCSCVKSKAALLVLIWNILVTVLMGYILEYGSVFATVYHHLLIINNSQDNQLQVYAPAYFGFLALVYCLFTLWLDACSVMIIISEYFPYRL